MARVHVLVVDDVPTLLAAFQIVLEASGFAVTTAPHGRAAIEEVRRSVPDLVLTDLEMPVLDGWQLLRALKQDHRTHDVPVVATTGVDVPEERAIAAGFDVLLRKPFTAADLIRTIGRFTARSEEPPEPGSCCGPRVAA